MRLFSNFIEKAVALLFPNRCLNCQKITTLKYFCKACGDVTKRIFLKICPDCGLPEKHCACRWNFYYFDEMISCFEADEATKRSFYSFKFGGNLSGGNFFSLEMAERLKNHPDYLDFEIITSVPSHRSTTANRGYDQVKVLANNIAKILKIKYTPILYQPKKSPKQHESSNIAERFLNVSGKYSVLKGADVKDKLILLVDDIKTTGATLSQCARELKLAGAKRVIAISALTVYPKSKADKKENETI